MGARESASTATAPRLRGKVCASLVPGRSGRPDILSSLQTFNAYPLDNGGALCIMVV